MNLFVFSKRRSESQRGLTLIDVIIGVALTTLLFTAIFGMFQLSLSIIQDSKSRAGANALLEERMEYIQSLAYESVGTEGGIPPGPLAQLEIIDLNNVTYTRRTLVQFYDSPSDGSGADDENGVIQDFKRVKVAISWQDDGSNATIESASYIVPKGIESTAGGGTLQIQVFDAVGDPVSSAEVAIANASTSPPIDTQVFTDETGTVYFSGAPASAGYEVMVSKPGYSTAQTYARTDENQAPDPGHLTVATSTVTKASFPIDVLSSIEITAQRPPQNATTAIDFSRPDNVLVASGTVQNSGTLQTDSAATSATAVIGPFGTSSVSAWGELSFSGTNPTLRLAESASPYTLLSDAKLANNSAGFTQSPVDISALSTSTNQFSLRASLEDGASLEQVAASFEAASTPVADLPVSVRGQKQIGTDADGSPLYKTNRSFSTNEDGKHLVEDIVWDSYVFEIDAPTDRIAKICPPTPLSIAPATTSRARFIVANVSGETDNTLRVTVRKAGGTVAENAVVTLIGAEQISAETGECGQVFFRDLEAGEYSLDVQKDTQSQQATVDVSGASVIDVTLSDS